MSYRRQINHKYGLQKLLLERKYQITDNRMNKNIWECADDVK